LGRDSPEASPNTREPLNDNRRTQMAHNTIYLDAKHPSQIILPVIPTAVVSAAASQWLQTNKSFFFRIKASVYK
jgi:hypothetical protein